MQDIEESISEIQNNHFPEDFKWGVSVAAYQIEGAHTFDGKGLSIWDVFSNKKGKIFSNHHGNTACDFYNLYQKDIDLVKKLNLPNFRFSIAWSRVLPYGVGEVNEAGIQFYNQVIDYCLANNIEPWVTIYHWDLPHELEKKGGWTNRESISWFSNFTQLCAERFGDRVKYWMVMNEPVVFTGAGYFLGIHAPGKRGIRNFLPAIHHVVLSIAKGAHILRNLLPNAEIGTTFSCSHIEPYRDIEKDKLAAKRIDALLNRLFIEPLLGLGYPDKDLPILRQLKKYILLGDEDNMKFDFDFIGIQNYTREIVKSSWFTPYVKANLITAQKRKVPITAMRWEIYPEAIYQMVKKFRSYPQIKKLYITENGAAFPDELVDGKVNDIERKSYLQSHIKQVLRAIDEELNVDGYFVWTLIDNFEWAEGYHPRFGLVYVDFETQERTMKESGLWFASFLKKD